MMMRLQAIIIFILLFGHGFSQKPDWLWCKTAIGNGDLNGLATDNAGNIYAAGVLSASMQFNTTTLTVDYGGTSDMFLVKYDGNGNQQWARQGVIDGQDRAINISTDPSGNVYLSGEFTSGMQLDTFSLNSYPNNNTTNIFIAKFDPNGVVQWAHRAGGDYYSNCYSSTTDNSGNFFLTGSFIGSYINFGPITINNPDQVNKTSCTFVAKYNSSGVVQWVKHSTGNVSNNEGAWPAAIAADPQGNVYVTGMFESSVVGFGPFSLTHSGNADVFTVKYAPDGTEQWAVKGGGANSEWAAGISVDANNDIVVAGYFDSPTATFGNAVLTNTNNTLFKNNLFLVKYNSSGNLIWAKNKDRTAMNALACDGSGNSYLLGTYRDSVMFGYDKLKYTSFGNFFLAKYDVNGNDVWGKDGKLIKAYSGNNFIMPHAIASKITNEIYVGGGFDCRKIAFDSCFVQNSDTTGNSRAIFLAKTNTTYVGLKENPAEAPSIHIYPNPGHDHFSIETKTSGTLELYNALGQKILEQKVISGNTTLNLNDLTSGVYIANFICSDGIKRSKIVKD